MCTIATRANSASGPARASPVLEVVRFCAADDCHPLGALYWAPEKPGKSIVLLIPGHIGAVLGSEHDYQPMANTLCAKGYAFLITQLRSLNNWPYAVFDDVVNDIGGAVAFAKERGYEDVALFGTSLGGPRVACFMAKKGDAPIRAVGFINAIKSPYLEFQLRQSESERMRLDDFLAETRKLVKQGIGNQPVTFENWFPGRHMVMTAKSFISFFGQEYESNAVSIKFAPRIKVPALVIHGKADKIALPANATAIHDSLTAAPQRDLIWIDCADHFLTPGPIAEKYAEEIADWVATTMPAR